MFEKQVVQNLRKPVGIIGRYVSHKLKSNFPEYLAILKNIDIKRGMRILEIGYGPGLGIEYIHKMHDVVIDGVDFSNLMYKKAIRRTKKYREKTNLVYGDFLEVKYQKDQYDLVLLLNVVYFWRDPKIGFEKIHQIIKKNGIIGISIAHPELLKSMQLQKYDVFNFHEIDSVKSILEDMKLSVIIKEDENCKGFFYLIATK